MNLLGYTITTSIPSEFQNQPNIISTINPHSYCIAKKDHDFEKALQQSDYLLPDGVGIVLAANFLIGKKIKKIAGYDLFMHFANKLNKEKGSCYFLGASTSTLEKIKSRMSIEYPQVKVGSFSPPYKAEFTAEESQQMLKKIQEFNPDILFVGMTAPKQEKWVQNHKNEIHANVVCSIGAVFDFYAGTVKRPSAFWINLGLEWLPRLLKEPKRLFKRNFISTPQFLWEILKFKFKLFLH